MKKTDAKDKYYLWVSTIKSEILVNKNILDRDLEKTEITITGNSLESCVKRLEREWRIICDTNDLKEAYSFYDTKSGTMVHAYVLELNINKDCRFKIEDLSHGEFIYCRDLIEILPEEVLSCRENGMVFGEMMKVIRGKEKDHLKILSI